MPNLDWSYTSTLSFAVYTHLPDFDPYTSLLKIQSTKPLLSRCYRTVIKRQDDTGNYLNVSNTRQWWSVVESTEDCRLSGRRFLCYLGIQLVDQDQLSFPKKQLNQKMEFCFFGLLVPGPSPPLIELTICLPLFCPLFFFLSFSKMSAKSPKTWSCLSQPVHVWCLLIGRRYRNPKCVLNFPFYHINQVFHMAPFV